MAEHFTSETEGRIGTVFTEEDALKAHHLATADPEIDGPLTSQEHEEKYGLDRAVLNPVEVDAADEPVEVPPAPSEVPPSETVLP